MLIDSDAEEGEAAALGEAEGAPGAGGAACADAAEGEVLQGGGFIDILTACLGGLVLLACGVVPQEELGADGGDFLKAKFGAEFGLAFVVGGVGVILFGGFDGGEEVGGAWVDGLGLGGRSF